MELDYHLRSIAQALSYRCYITINECEKRIEKLRSMFYGGTKGGSTKSVCFWKVQVYAKQDITLCLGIKTSGLVL